MYRFLSIYLHIFISSFEYFFQFQFHFLRIIINNYKYKYNYKYRLSILASTSYVFFTSWLWSFMCFFGKNSADSLRQIRHKTDFLWPVFSRIRTESRISPYKDRITNPSLYGKMLVGENLLYEIFYAVIFYIYISW